MSLKFSLNQFYSQERKRSHRKVMHIFLLPALLALQQKNYGLLFRDAAGNNTAGVSDVQVVVRSTKKAISIQ